jgi:hypothetical protein
MIAWSPKQRDGYVNWSGKIPATKDVLAARETPDDLTATGRALTVGTLAAAETADGFTAYRDLVAWRPKRRDGFVNWSAKRAARGVNGQLAGYELPDSFAGAGRGILLGALAASEAPDSLVVQGKATVVGTIVAEEQGDKFWSSVSSVTSGELSTTEAGDVVDAVGRVIGRGTMAAGESPDSFTARVYTFGALSAFEAADAFAAEGTMRLLGQMDVLELADGLIGVGSSVVRGTMAGTEGLDRFVGTPSRVVPVVHRMAPMALRLITKHGQPVTLRVLEPGEYNPATGSVEEQPVEYPSVGVRLDYEQRHIDGTVIRQGDQKLLLPPQNVPRPETGNVVMMNGKPFRVVSVGAVDPNGLPALYELQLRGVA